MTEAAVKQEPVAGTGSDVKQERERSKIEFPYTALDLAITLAKAVHELGNHCDWAQLGARLDMAADGGGFRQRLMAAKTFGLITYTSRAVTLTHLGVQINDPEQFEAAKVEAFLTVPLYKAIYEQFRNGTLPGAAGLENAMVTHGVAQKQKDKARQAFQRSATEAGFFAASPNRLVAPVLRQVKKHVPVPAGEERARDEGNGKPLGGVAGGDGPTLPPLHPFIKGLLETLPAAGTDWTLEGRKDWLQTASGIFRLIYKTGEKGEVTVALNVPTATPGNTAP